MRFDLTVFGDTQFSREIVRTGERGGDMRPAFRSIFDRMFEINREQFLSQGRRGSGGWEPINPEYKVWKAEHGFDTDILFKTHALFEAMGFVTSDDNEVMVAENWAVFRVTGEPGEYGPFHQSGTEHMPARPPFALTALDRREFFDEMQDYIFTGRVRNFL